MSFHIRSIGFGLAVSFVMSAPLAAQPKLEAFANIVGGAGGSCGTFGMPSQLSFFTVSLPFLGGTGNGISDCGYAGALSTVSQNGGIGKITNAQSLGPTSLGDSPNSYQGTANSSASYGSLGASAHSLISGDGTTGNPLALFNSIGASTFSDFITASSPLIANLSSGYVRYKFAIDGFETALGAQRAFFFGDTYAVLDLQHNAGPTYEIMNAHTTRGSNGTISNRPPPSGWTSSTGSLSGGSTFFSVFLPFTWGTQWSLKVGLLAWSYGTAEANFLNSAKVSGIDLFDANQNAVTNFTLTSASGTDYQRVGETTTVPEPSTLVLSFVSLCALAIGRQIVRRLNT